ncbi:hypothetical protein [Halospeciosus flavus]|uniref:Uncharacterized protein n=1 Tax=Halospeciosus flavus TaxID=3032283 RepID=A0ABD5Z0U7_9EURY|nr:hypothetical protein [Halospeciosus flavus]
MVDVDPLEPDALADAFSGYDDPAHRRRRAQLRDRLERGSLDALVLTAECSIPDGWVAAMRERVGRSGTSANRVRLTLALAAFLDRAGHDLDATGTWDGEGDESRPLYDATHFGGQVDAAHVDLVVDADVATLAGDVGYVSPDVLAHADKRVRLERGDRVVLTAPFSARDGDRFRFYAFATPETPLAEALFPDPDVSP